MGILALVLLGGLAGSVAITFIGANAKMGVLGNMLVGIVASVIGGWVFNHLGSYGVAGLNLRSLTAAIVTSTVLLLVANMATGRRQTAQG